MRPSSLCIAFTALAAAGPAAADVELTSDAGPRDLRETEHRRRLELRPLWLEVTDRHRFENRGKGSRQLIYRFELPATAALTGVTITAGGKTHAAVALDSDAAIRPLPAATADVERSDLALLRAIGPARYELTVYPVDPGTAIAAAITWTTPVALAEGQVSATLPERGNAANLAPSQIAARTAGWGSVKRLDDLTLDGVRRRRLTRQPGVRPLAIGARARFGKSGPLELSLAAVELDSGLHALALAGIAGPAFRNLGRYLHVIIAVDISASMERSGLGAAARVADAILAELPPETRVAVIPFDRRPRPLAGGFGPNDHRIRSRVARALAVNRPKNGSDLGAALASANALLDTRQVRRLTADARVSGEPTAAIITISDQGTPLSLTESSALGRVSKFARAESVFFAVTIARDGRSFPRPLSGALDRLVSRSGGASFAVRPGQVARQAPAIAKSLGVSSPLGALRGQLGGRELDELELPDRLAPGSGFVALIPWAGPPPRSIAVTADRRSGDLSETVRRRRHRRLEALAAPLLLRRLDPAAVAAAHRRAESSGRASAPLSPERDAARQIARAGVRHPAVGPRLSLVIAHPGDRLAGERLAFARKWGSWLYRRAPTPAEVAGDVEHAPWRAPATQIASAPKRRIAPRRGTLDARTLRRAIRTQLYRRIRRCYDRELRAAPRLRGSLTVRFELADGETRAVDLVDGSIARSGLRHCVVDAAYRLKPPRAANDHDTVYVVRYPFRFRVRDRRGHVSEDDGSGKAIELDPDDPLGGID